MKFTIKYLFLLWLAVSMQAAFGQSDGYVENKGQWPANVTHKFNLPSGHFWLEKGGWSLSFMDADQRANALHALHQQPIDTSATLVHGHRLKVRWAYSNAAPEVISKDASKAYYNYFLGSDQSKWANRVHGYKQVIHKGIYPGIDVILDESHHSPKMT
ncbi:hypothetical protein N8Z47_01880, partial [Salibacteraceae bacterium]|nr:hypothetical protein [Salibacteraceae bacterium]